MKLDKILKDEVHVSFHVNCSLCDRPLCIPQNNVYCKDTVIKWATEHGWNSYETDNETCGAACPDCIKDIRENLT